MEQQEIFVKMALHAWNVQVGRVDKFLSDLSHDDYFKEIAPGKNRIIYLLGHLTAINDNMIVLFALGNRSFAQLDEAFVKKPDKSGEELPSPDIVKNHWVKSNAELTSYFNKMPYSDWFTKHTIMSDEDFVKEPTRNKLSVLLNRTNHIAYRLGQMVLIKS